MVKKYEERPPTIDAQQFTGGEPSADQMSNWLSSYGGMVTYDSTRDRLIIQANGAFFTAIATDWVSMDGSMKISVMSDEDFTTKYKPNTDSNAGGNSDPSTETTTNVKKADVVVAE